MGLCKVIPESPNLPLGAFFFLCFVSVIVLTSISRHVFQVPKGELSAV